MIVRTGDLDIFYISYDEPNKEEHWADLKNKFPFAKRVDGVKGFDNAHKECARQSTTDRFITIDGDNIVDPAFFTLEVSIPEDTDMAKSVISWSAKNSVNGLVYGNGGIKCWPRELVLNMKTHEEAETESMKIDFCWDLEYIQMNNTYSVIFNSGSPFQAFRAGYREGVKMSLDRGYRVHLSEFKTKIWPKNYERLITWCNVGADVENGLWAIYGARLGCYDVNFNSEFKTEFISDFEWFSDYFTNTVLANIGEGDELCSRSGVKWDYDNLYNEAVKLGQLLDQRMDLELCEPTPEVSRFFKRVYTNAPRNPGLTAKERQIGSK